jgi:transcription initiation factor TFIID subunit 2
LIDLNALKTPALVRYIFSVLSTDPSPYIRHRVWQALGKGLGMIAIGDNQPVGHGLNPGPGEMTIVDESADDSNDRKDVLARETIDGALANLKKVLTDNEVFKVSLWKAATYVVPNGIS